MTESADLSPILRMPPREMASREMRSRNDSRSYISGPNGDMTLEYSPRNGNEEVGIFVNKFSLGMKPMFYV